MDKDEFIANYGETVWDDAKKCYRKLKGYPFGEDAQDIISEITLKIIETFSTKIEENTLNFRGEAEFTTFIYGAVYISMREKLYGKKHYPVSLNPFGSAGRMIYDLLYINRLPRTEALRLVSQETGLTWEEVDDMDKDIASSLKTKIIRKKDASSNEIGENQLDEFLSESHFSHSETPQAELLKGELRTKIFSILEKLKQQHNQIITMKVIEGVDVATIREEMSLKNNQAVYNMFDGAKKAFVKEAKKQNLADWLDLSYEALMV